MAMVVEKHICRLEAIFQDKCQYRRLLSQTGEFAQRLLDFLQLLIDYPGLSNSFRSKLCFTMIRLSKNAGLLPRCLVINNVQQIGDQPVAGGGFGDVWRGYLGGRHSHRRLVCLKVIRTFEGTDVECLSEQYMREAMLWRQLKHPNVLPFMGLYYLDQSRRRICLVCPWMENGNLVQFLKANQNADRTLLAHDVCSGISYLHENKLVHGDLKGVNVLITPEGRAAITDFGLSRISDSSVLTNTDPTSHSGGTVRWLAPELLVGGQRSSKESDMYAFGCLCYEIFTGCIPFYELPNDASVVYQVLVQGTRPSRPEALLVTVPDVIWSLMDFCWHSSPSARPTAPAALVALRSIISHQAFVPASNWDEGLFNELWDNVGQPHLPPGLDVLGIETIISQLETGTTSRSFSAPAVVERSPLDGVRQLQDTDFSEDDTFEETGLVGISGGSSSTPSLPLYMSPLPIDSPQLPFLSHSSLPESPDTHTITGKPEWAGNISRHNDTEISWDTENWTAHTRNFTGYRPRTPSLTYSSSTSSVNSTPPATPSIAAREIRSSTRRGLNIDAPIFIPGFSLRTRTMNKVSIKRPDGSEVDLLERVKYRGPPGFVLASRKIVRMQRLATVSSELK